MTSSQAFTHSSSAAGMMENNVLSAFQQQQQQQQQQQSQQIQNGQFTAGTAAQSGYNFNSFTPLFGQIGPGMSTVNSMGIHQVNGGNTLPHNHDIGSTSQQQMLPYPQHEGLVHGFQNIPGHGQVNPFISNMPGIHPIFANRFYDESGDYDDSMAMEDDSGDWMEMSDDPVMQARLRVVQQAQQAASEGSTGIFSCPYCDKQYAGKHARSIWRRHLQDKHFIPLSQQPRRTRWDGNANRPKNAEERRQRMLESKRRWARKRRLQDKAALNGNGESIGDASTNAGSPEEDETSRSDTEEAIASAEAAALIKKEEEMAAVAQASIQQKEDPTMQIKSIPATKKKPLNGGGEKKPRGMQQLKFQHHMTTSNMPRYPEQNHNVSHSSGAITAVWPAINGAKAHMNGNYGQRNFAKHASMPSIPQQSASAMFNAPNPSRQPFAEVNRDPKARRLSIEATMPLNKPKKQKKGSNKADQNQLESNNMQGYPMKSTPINRFSTLYPTPPSAGDDRSLAAQVFGGSGERIQRGSQSNGSGLLSPPASQRTLESSPSFMSSASRNGTYNVNEAVPSSLTKRHNASSMLSPVSSNRRQQQSPISNPFSLDRHKISPATNISKRSEGILAPPASASRLSNAMKTGKDIELTENQEENRLSPLQTRTNLEKDGESPVSKNRKLPPLVKTPLRSALLEGLPTPANGTTAFAAMSGLGSASVQKLTRSRGGLNGTIGATPSIKGVLSATTPTQNDRMMNSTNLLGLTPFDIRNSSKYSASRTGYFSRISPLKRGSETNGGVKNGTNADQFSSPQHLHLTQSLGLAPHSTSKGSSSLLGGLTSLTGTPYAGNSFLSMNSPWPDSILRPSFRMSASKRGADGMMDGEEMDDGEIGVLDTPAAARMLGGSNDDENDMEDDDGHLHMHETPSRPDKNKRVSSSLLGSPTTARSGATRSQQSSAQKRNGSTPVDNSSINRSQRSITSASNRRLSEHQAPLPPLSFKLSSPSPLMEEESDEEEGKSNTKQQNSFDSELLMQNDFDSSTKSPTTSTSSSSLRTELQDEDNIELSV